MNQYWSGRARALTPYVPGEQPRQRNLIKLNTNENPYPPSPVALAAIREAVGDTLRLYPDPECTALRELLAATYGLKPEQIFVGNGSDEVLALCFQAFFDPDRPILFPDITYSFYPVYAGLYGLSYREVPLDEQFAVPVEPFLGNNGGVVLANPNAPTGRELSLCGIRAILEGNPEAVVVVDEAYVDFGGESCRGLIDTYDNLLVCMTFSKSRSMAGGRLGFALGSPELIADLNRLKFSTNPYNINRLTLVAAEAALDSGDYYEKNCRAIMENRSYTVEELQKLGFTTIPSLANFIFTRCPKCSGVELYRKLKARGVLVRCWDKPALRDYVRVTIGSKKQMDVFLSQVRAILEEG